MDSESPMITEYVGADGQPLKNYNAAEKDALRSFCFLGGCSLIAVSAVAALNVFAILTPSIYALNLFQGAFGLCAMIVEGKNYNSLQKYYAQVEAYARFLTLPNSKAIFYLLLGVNSLVLSGLTFMHLVEGIFWIAAATAILLIPNRN